MTKGESVGNVQDGLIGARSGFVNQDLSSTDRRTNAHETVT